MIAAPLSDAALARWIAWSFVLAPGALRQAFDDGGDIGAAPLRPSEVARGERTLRHYRARGLDIIALPDGRYPTAARQRLGRRAPFFLTCRGDWRLLDQPLLLVAGSDWMTDYAESATRTLIAALAGRGVATVATVSAEGVSAVVRAEARAARMALVRLERRLWMEDEASAGPRDGAALTVYAAPPWEVRPMERTPFCRLALALAGAAVVVAPCEDDLSGLLGALSIRLEEPCHVLRSPLLAGDYPATDALPRQGARSLEVGAYFVPRSDDLEALTRGLWADQPSGVAGEQLELF